MKLALDALVVLDAIDRSGSFAAAAQALHRVPSAVTYSVRKLEDDLGVKLFDRSGQRAALTAAGKELLAEGRHLLRAASELEARVQRIATGWEAQLSIAVSDLISIERLYPLVREFYKIECGTRLRLSREVLGGVWDALAGGRADLALGAPGDAPAGGGCTVHSLGMLDFVFAVAPSHPLARAAEPIASVELARHRAVAAADSSRELEPRSAGLQAGQDTLTVPDTLSKLSAQIEGLGIGFLPAPIARAAVAAGKLIVKQVEEPKPAVALSLAWKARHKGKALAWWVDRIRRVETWV